MKLSGIILLLLFAGFGCSNHENPVSENTAKGILQGRVTIGPICPVERIGQVCEPSPEIYEAHHVAILSGDGQSVIQEVKTDGRGYYQTQLDAGTYVVDFRPHDIGMRFETYSHTATIRAGEVTVVNIDIDTGIR